MPRALTILLVLLMFEGVIGWLIAVADAVSGFGIRVSPVLLLPWAVRGLSRYSRGWRDFMLVYSTLTLIFLAYVAFCLFEGGRVEKQAMPWNSSGFMSRVRESVLSGEPFVNVLLIFTAITYLWAVYVLRRAGVMARFGYGSKVEPGGSPS